MCVCLYMYIYMYMYTVYIYAYIHTYIHTVFRFCLRTRSDRRSPSRTSRNLKIKAETPKPPAEQGISTLELEPSKTTPKP